ncbi:MAG: M48 family metalloprotease [Alphaproteobacteria bacterium]|nr:M48 family metalloprotease [Alphaproteobacteria bacterium]
MECKKLPDKVSINRPLRESFRFFAAISPVLAACGLDYYLTPDVEEFAIRQAAYLLSGYVFLKGAEYLDFPFSLREKNIKKPPARISAKFDELCQKAGLKGAEIVEYDSDLTAGAYENKVILGPTLINETEKEAQNFTIGHEISHVYNKDMKTVQTLTTVGFLALAGILGQFVMSQEDSATVAKFFAYVAASVSILLGTRYAWLRSVEYRCDEDGVLLNGDSSGAIKFFESLKGDWGELEETKSWFSTHPTPQKRLDNLKRKFC